jgi:subtilisin-like proprotein convertase family protein
MLSHEGLEQRQPLAVDSFHQVTNHNVAPDTPGWMVITATDDLYIQQVSTSPQSLIFADNSSFADAKSLKLTPQEMAIAFNELPNSAKTGATSEIIGIDNAIGTIYVTNGEHRSDANVYWKDSPLVISDSVNGVFETGFPLSNPRINLYGGELKGTLLLPAQSAGETESRWTFTNWNGDTRFPQFTDRIRITSGPGYGGQQNWYQGDFMPYKIASAGQAFPKNITVGGLPGVTQSNGTEAVLVNWSNQLGGSGPLAPTIESIDYTWQQLVVTRTGAFTEIISYINVRSRDAKVPASAPAKALFSLPNATGMGSLGIVPGTLTGKLLPAVSTDLDPAPLASFRMRELNVADRTKVPLVFDRNGYSGVADLDKGLVQISSPAGSPVTLSADYAVYTQSAKPTNVTFFAGHDITRQLSVDLLTPGSTINVDTPIKVGKLANDFFVGPPGVSGAAGDLLYSGDIELRATNVNINATMTSRDRLTIGMPVDSIPQANVLVAPAPRIEPTRQVFAAPVVSGGQVVALTVPSGGIGAGYDPNNPPLVTLSAPTGETATASVAEIVGSIPQNGIILTAGGSGYEGVVTVEVSPPDKPNGVQALAEAVVNATNKTITKINLLNGGSGYSRVPTITIRNDKGSGATAGAIVEGKIVKIDVVTNGLGYTTPPKVSIKSDKGIDATAVARVGAGGVISIDVTNGGSRYSTNDIEVTIDPPPPITNGRRASFEPVFEELEGVRTNRIVGFRKIDGGFGYGKNATATIDAPLTPTPATAAATVQNGKLTSIRITNAGLGYATPPRIVIDAPPTGSAGRTAQATAVLDSKGALQSIRIDDPGEGYEDAAPPRIHVQAQHPGVIVETITTNAVVSASIFDIRVGNDINTPEVNRGQILVTQTGSFGSGGGGGQAGSLFVQAIESDIVVEGTINVKNQSYLLQSAPANFREPYKFTTTSRSGAVTGSINGSTLAITLANDLPTIADQGTAYNEIALETQVDSLRVRAASTKGRPIYDPFPYKGFIRDINSISIDALVGSGNPLTISAGGDITFTAATATASDLIVNANDFFNVLAPISTTRGRLLITADNISVNSSLQVSSAAYDPGTEDIVLTAIAGDITMNGLVSTPNIVRLTQLNRTTGSNRPPQFSTVASQAIPAAGTARMDITVADSFVFSDINVIVDIVHNYDASLQATLIAPDGTRVPLFGGVGGSGDNFTNTILDHEATQPIATGNAPFTGRFRPAGSLAQLYGRNAKGVWQIEVTDQFGFSNGGANALRSFGIEFRPTTQLAGTIAGAARITADTLVIDSEGAVGNASKLPGDPLFYLRTDVNYLQARARGNVSIDDLSDLSVDFLQTPGLVSLRAAGVDPVTNPQGRATVAALRGFLTDVTALDANAPNGSIDLGLNTASTITLGNASALALDKATRAGKVFGMSAGGDVRIRSLGGSSPGDMILLDAPLAASGARRVKFLVSQPLTAAYDPRRPGAFASTITSSAAGDLRQLPGMTAARLGDRLLVSGGVSANGGLVDTRANGVYVVTSLGGSGSKWVLTRAADSDTGNELANNTVVVVDGGSTVGQAYRMTYAATPTAPFGMTPIKAQAFTARTDIGSDDRTDPLQYVVSTTDGTNSAPGSLGRMINLRQSNTPSVAPNSILFKFSAAIVDPIRLQQELPLITGPLAINGIDRFPAATGPARPVVIDGSRIVTRRNNTGVVPGSEVNGFDISGTGASNFSIAGITISGFQSGAAIAIDNAKNGRIDNVVTGVDERGERLISKYGITVKSTAPGSVAGLQITNSRILSSTAAGISLQGTASGVSVIGNKIGELGRDNIVGIEVLSSGANAIGSPTGARNQISNNYTGVLLAAGSTTITNSTIGSNIFDGVKITGGVNVIGATNKVSPTSNSISGNGGWGVHFATLPLATAQRVIGNRLGLNDLGAAAANKSGDVGVAGVKAAASLGYEFDPKTGVDRVVGKIANGNQHAISSQTVATARPGARRMPWRGR